MLGRAGHYPSELSLPRSRDGHPGSARRPSPRGGAHLPTHRVTLIPGDGVGPELTDAARRAIDATGVQIEWEVHELGARALERDGSPLPQSALDAIRSMGLR